MASGIDTRHILITRPAEDAERLAQTVTERGFTPIIEPLLNIIAQDHTLPETDQISSLIFTSKNAVRSLQQSDIRKLKQIPVFTVGDKTATCAREAGFEDITSASGTVDDLKQILQNAGSFDADKFILYISGQDITDDLSDLSLNIKRVVTYKAETPSSFSPALVSHIKERNLQAISFFSERTASHFVALITKENLDGELDNIAALCISEKVRKAVDKLPWKAILTAESPEQNSLLARLDDI